MEALLHCNKAVQSSGSSSVWLFSSMHMQSPCHFSGTTEENRHSHATLCSIQIILFASFRGSTSTSECLICLLAPLLLMTLCDTSNTHSSKIAKIMESGDVTHEQPACHGTSSRPACQGLLCLDAFCISAAALDCRPCSKARSDGV